MSFALPPDTRERCGVGASRGPGKRELALTLAHGRRRNVRGGRSAHGTTHQRLSVSHGRRGRGGGHTLPLPSPSAATAVLMVPLTLWLTLWLALRLTLWLTLRLVRDKAHTSTRSAVCRVPGCSRCHVHSRQERGGAHVFADTDVSRSSLARARSPLRAIHEAACLVDEEHRDSAFRPLRVAAKAALAKPRYWNLRRRLARGLARRAALAEVVSSPQLENTKKPMTSRPSNLSTKCRLSRKVGVRRLS